MDTRSPKTDWAGWLPSGLSSRDLLAQVVDSDGGRDAEENELFDIFNHPQSVLLESERRSFKGQLGRRLKRLESRTKHQRSP